MMTLSPTRSDIFLNCRKYNQIYIQCSANLRLSLSVILFYKINDPAQFRLRNFKSFNKFTKSSEGINYLMPKDDLKVISRNKINLSWFRHQFQNREMFLSVRANIILKYNMTQSWLKFINSIEANLITLDIYVDSPILL